MTELDQATINSFVMEFRECIENVTRYVLRVEENPDDTESIHALFRNLHNIKGNAGILEADKISRLSHKAEALLDAVREQTLRITSDMIETLLAAADMLTALVDEFEAKGSVDEDQVNGLVSTISSYLQGRRPPGQGKAPQQAGPAAAPAGNSIIQNKVMVVDDEKPIRELFKKALVKAGYMVHCVGSPEEALDLLKKENIQVMFLDLKLPGMSGVDLCGRIRKDKPLAIIYAMTGYVSLFELTTCREAGFDDYFTKPVEVKTVVSAAEAAFERLDRWMKQRG